MNTIQNHPPIVGSEPPPQVTQLRLRWRHEGDTEAFCQTLATALLATPEAGNLYIELRGDLGAGKTTFTRHLLRALGVRGRVKSPTYAVVEPYETPALSIWHFDFYRFDDPREWEDAGFRELFSSTGLKVAEWPEKAEGHIPPADLVLHIQNMTDDDSRDVELTARSKAGRQLLRVLAGNGHDDQEDRKQS